MLFQGYLKYPIITELVQLERFHTYVRYTNSKVENVLSR